MMYYNHQVPKPIYVLKYDFAICDQYFYDDLVATIFPFTIYSYTNLPAPTYFTAQNYYYYWSRQKYTGQSVSIYCIFTFLLDKCVFFTGLKI